MFKSITKLAVAAALVTSALAKADDIALGLPAYGGTGCPAGTVDAVLAPDAKTLSVLFDGFVAEAGQGTGKSIDRKSCNLAIPIHIPQGFSVSLIGVDYRGYVNVPNSSSEARFNVDYFFAGSTGPKISNVFVGPQDQDYLLSDTLQATALVWSRCGVDTNIRINASMMAKARTANSPTVLATVDSADVTAGLVYHLQWRRCP